MAPPGPPDHHRDAALHGPHARTHTCMHARTRLNACMHTHAHMAQMRSTTGTLHSTVEVNTLRGSGGGGGSLGASWGSLAGAGGASSPAEPGEGGAGPEQKDTRTATEMYWWVWRGGRGRGGGRGDVGQHCLGTWRRACGRAGGKRAARRAGGADVHAPLHAHYCRPHPLPLCPCRGQRGKRLTKEDLVRVHESGSSILAGAASEYRAVCLWRGAREGRGRMEGERSTHTRGINTLPDTHPHACPPNPCTSQTTSQPTIQPTNQPFKHPTNQPTG
jgi:hypothetical protein